MIISIDPFMTTSPKKIIEKADIYSKTLQNFHQLPISPTKQSSVQRHAENHKKHVQLTVQKSQYQQDLYRWKEKQDLTTRHKFQQKISRRQSTNDKNQAEIDKKRAKERQLYEKHLKEVYTRYCQEEKKNRENEKEGALKLRNELVEFYHKQASKKRHSEHRQVSVGSCYESAVDRINSIHHKNEQFSLKAEQSLASSLVRNSHFEKIIGTKRSSLSASNRKKMITYRHSIDLYNSRELKFIQKCGNNEFGTLNAWHHQDEDNQKTKKRIGQFFKKRVQRWSQQKHKIDQKNAQVPQKCNTKLDKTTKASFRQTASTFRSTAKQWFSIVERNKASIKQFDEMRKDEIMNIHLDLRLKNDSISKISERMKSLRHQAKKTADDFL